MATEIEKQAKIDAANAQLMGGWDDIEVSPDFATFPSGTYMVVCKKMTHNADEGFIDVTLELAEDGVVDVPDSNIPVPVAGSLYFERYRLAFGGQSNWAKVFRAVAMHKGLSPVEFMEQAAEEVFCVTIKARADKQDKTKFYNNLVSAQTSDMLQ
jgi:hypothetical protein